jgi:hypothetical protein
MRAGAKTKVKRRYEETGDLTAKLFEHPQVMDNEWQAFACTAEEETQIVKYL